jgi:hypothetical protein
MIKYDKKENNYIDFLIKTNKNKYIFSYSKKYFIKKKKIF